MSYDTWKTRSPDDEMAKALRADGEKLRALTGEDHGPFEDEPTDLDLAYADLHAAQAEARRYREALINLFCVVKALSCPGGLSTETLREYLRTHQAAKEAADLLHTSMEENKF